MVCILGSLESRSVRNVSLIHYPKKYKEEDGERTL